MNLRKYAKGAGQPLITAGQLKALQIPVPIMAEQLRIIDVLNKLEILTCSITEGLPKEIALRQQQYEYYREQLLDFPK